MYLTMAVFGFVSVETIHASRLGQVRRYLFKKLYKSRHLIGQRDNTCECTECSHECCTTIVTTLRILASFLIRFQHSNKSKLGSLVQYLCYICVTDAPQGVNTPLGISRLPLTYSFDVAGRDIQVRHQTLTHLNSQISRGIQWCHWQNSQMQHDHWITDPLV